MSSNPGLFSLPIPNRPSNSWRTTLNATLFIITFNFGCLMIHASQLVFLLPLKIIPFHWAKQLYAEGNRYAKGSFGCLIILMCQWFAPTKLKITFEMQGKGSITSEDIESMVVRNKEGGIVSLNLPTKFVLVGNHQVYADWWYAWCFTYFMSPHGVHRYVYITLKKSLQWVPVVGWAMQFFDFIFLARSWASDRLQLASHLASLGAQAEREDRPLCFILYPEGTLVSKDTRPISKKFADKMGIPDLKNILLPRSTGLQYSLRSLAPRIPDLHLLDLTVVYPGIPPMGYGQSYYTLRSIFLDGISPPAIHMHIRLFDITQAVPIGTVAKTKSTNEIWKREQNLNVDIPSEEKEIFDLWLRELWQEKDESISRFHETGGFMQGTAIPSPTIEVPVRLRRKHEILHAFFFFLPAGVAYLWGKH